MSQWHTCLRKRQAQGVRPLNKLICFWMFWKHLPNSVESQRLGTPPCLSWGKHTNVPPFLIPIFGAEHSCRSHLSETWAFEMYSCEPLLLTWPSSSYLAISGHISPSMVDHGRPAQSDRIDGTNPVTLRQGCLYQSFLLCCLKMGMGTFTYTQPWQRCPVLHHHSIHIRIIVVVSSYISHDGNPQASNVKEFWKVSERPQVVKSTQNGTSKSPQLVWTSERQEKLNSSHSSCFKVTVSRWIKVQSPKAYV